ATILGCVRFKQDALPPAVGLYITSAYWFTSSTSFANPAVTIARALSDTFAGIAPRDVPGFLVAELLGALAAAYLFRWLFEGIVMPTRAKKKLTIRAKNKGPFCILVHMSAFIRRRISDVRFIPKSRHSHRRHQCLLSALAREATARKEAG